MQKFLRDIINQAGQISLDYRSRLDNLVVDRKHSPHDLVTQADQAIEAFLIQRIQQKYPGHAILGEEHGALAGSEYRWIIDPIDGTTSFIHGQPTYTISVGIERNGEFVLGAVLAPVLNELFTAEKGGGAQLNGRALHVSERKELADSVLATGFACIRAGEKRNNLPYFNTLMPRIRGIRRFGSAALDMCYVAAGRLEGYWELNLNIYDCAAGYLIVEEAGGRVSDFTGGLNHLYDEMLCTNGLVHDEMMAVFAEVRQREKDS